MWCSTDFTLIPEHFLEIAFRGIVYLAVQRDHGIQAYSKQADRPGSGMADPQLCPDLCRCDAVSLEPSL